MFEAPTKELLNGIDVLRLLEARAIRPRGRFRAVSAWRGGSRSHNTAGRFRFAAQGPTALFGGREAATPQELLLAALNAGLIAAYAGEAAARGIRLTQLSVETDAEMRLAELPAADGARARVRLAADAAPELLRRLHEAVAGGAPQLRLELVLDPV